MKNVGKVTVEEITKLIARWYSAYSLSPSELLWWDLKLLEAIRREYEELEKE